MSTIENPGEGRLGQAMPLSRRWVIWTGVASAAAAGLPAGAGESGRTWATRAYTHFDRTASPWLIKRFIDPQAKFVFVPWGRESEAPKDAIKFSMPGAELGVHDDAGTTFQKLINKYQLTDPGVLAMAKIINAGVAFVLKGARPAAGDVLGEMAFGLLALSDGLLLINPTDEANLAAGFVNYDALYATLRANQLVAEKGLTIPPPGTEGPGPKTKFLRAVLNDAGVPLRGPSPTARAR